MSKALSQAKNRADDINSHPSISCRLITGTAGTPDTIHYVETQFLQDGEWKRLRINGRQSTGFPSPEQVRKIHASGEAELHEYDIDDALFASKTEHINKILHDGGINKRNRASVLACLLLALADDSALVVNKNAITLVEDINTRAKAMLKQYGKANFFDEIRIDVPASETNHAKYHRALAGTIGALRDLNIASMINSGRDVLGQFYEQLLQYANDAKELGIVLTPRHITTFAADALNVSRDDMILDPACGTGGFLVAALDKVRRDGGGVTAYKAGNLHGIEQDPLIATLAIINMIFRGDGSSNISEGDCFNTTIHVEPHKVLMNPPFALKDEYEWKFVERALESIRDGGLLFAVLPPTTMMSSSDDRQELLWRRQMLQRHTLIAVVKLPEDLFYPHVAKGTYGVFLQAHRPHDINGRDVIWAIMNDGIVRSKTAKPTGGGIYHCSSQRLVTSFLHGPSRHTRRWRLTVAQLAHMLDPHAISHQKTISGADPQTGKLTSPLSKRTWAMVGGRSKKRANHQIRFLQNPVQSLSYWISSKRTSEAEAEEQKGWPLDHCRLSQRPRRITGSLPL